MSTEKPVILTDIDGVVLEWLANLPHYIADIGRDPSVALSLIHTDNWAHPEDLFGTETREEAMQYMDEYGRSILMACLPAYDKTAIPAINRLKKDFDFIGITAIGTDFETFKHRSANLHALFPNAFKELHCLPFGGDKSDYIAKYKHIHGDNIFCYVDDWDKHVEEAESVGVRGIRYGQINRGNPTRGHKFVNDWEHLEVLANHWLDNRHESDVDPVVEYWKEKELQSA